MIYGPEFGFLQLDSENRKIQAERTIKRSFRHGYDLPDDTLTHVFVAEYMKRTEADRRAGLDLAVERERPLDVDACAKFVAERRASATPGRLPPVLVGARLQYESFFDKDLPRNVPGWDDFLCDIACANLHRSQHEISVAVWAASRRQAALEGTMSSVPSPQIHFDHSALGREFMPVTRLAENEPFVEIDRPFIGVIGVNDAWMYLDEMKVDTYSSEVVSFYRADWPEALEELSATDEPIVGRPLGFNALPFSAEGYARSMSVDESAEFIFEQFGELIKANESDEDFDKKYVAAVLQTGVLARPAMIERVGFTTHAGELMSTALDSYKTRETVFTAWDKLLDRAKSLGITVREFDQEFADLTNEFGKRFTGKPFTIRDARESLTLLRVNRTVPEIVEHLTELQTRDASIERAQRELERPSLPPVPRTQERRDRPSEREQGDRGDDDGGPSIPL